MRTVYAVLAHRLSEARRASVVGGVDWCRIRRKSFLLIASFATLLTFMLAACGTNTGAGTGSTPPAAPATVQGYGTSNGCPSDVVVNTPPAAPNIIVKSSNNNSTVNAHAGDVIEVDLPFGVNWTGPTASQGVLELQTPAGYAWKASKMCVWRFVAQGTGISQVTFYSRAICKKGQLCPQYITRLPFTFSVK